MMDRDALAAFLAGALDWDLGRAADLADDAIRQADRPEPARHWEGEARAAFDQGLASLPRGDFGDASFWTQRAQVAATLAGAEQARIANLIAWKQLAATRAATHDLGVDLMPLGDTVSDTIERGLGIA